MGRETEESSRTNIRNFDEFAEVPGADEIAVAALLLRNLQLLQFNAHEFFETRTSERHRFRGSRPVYLGVAIYPMVARFNHDCYPAVTRQVKGKSVVESGVFLVSGISSSLSEK